MDPVEPQEHKNDTASQPILLPDQNVASEGFVLNDNSTSPIAVMPDMIVPSENPVEQVIPETPVTIEKVQENNTSLPTIEPFLKERVVSDTHPLIHTYQDDLSRAMNATDATAVQEMLVMAREREAASVDGIIKNRQRGWYVSVSIVLIALALLVVGYGAYHFMNLTVPVEKTISVGVFSNTDPISIEGNTIENVIDTFVRGETTLPEGKPVLLSLVRDTATQVPISNQELFTFLEATLSEPFATAIAIVRYGMVNTGNEVVPLIIASVPNPELASKEFLIAEPKMLEQFQKALTISTDGLSFEVGKGFTSEYLYNLPVRTLRYTDTISSDSRIVMLYGYANSSTIVITSKQAVLKAVYDAIIRQR